MTMHAVLRLIHSDFSKVILFCTLTIIASAIASPWIYNVGMLLAEVGKSRALNPLLDWLANRCADATFASFYNYTLLGCAIILAGPFIMWCKLSNQSSLQPSKPWRIRLPTSANTRQNGQALCRNPKAKLHLVIGFLITGSLVSISIYLLEMIAWFSFIQPADYWGAIRSGLLSAIVITVVSEWLFRGILMGIFIRAMRPAMAMVFISLFYAIIYSLLPTGNEIIANPDKADAGFRMIITIAENLLTPEKFTFSFMLLFSLGLVLAYARYRTASLWLPIGLHFGFIFPYQALQQLTESGTQHSPLSRLLIGADGRSGLLPFCLLLLSALLVHVFIQLSESKRISET